MAIDKDRLHELALQVAQVIEDEKKTGKPHLRLIVPESARPAPLLSDETRAAYIRRIYFIAGRYCAHFLLDQELEGPNGATPLEQVSDEKLIELRQLMEKALKCALEGVSYDDAGLVRWAC